MAVTAANQTFRGGMLAVLNELPVRVDYENCPMLASDVVTDDYSSNGTAFNFQFNEKMYPVSLTIEKTADDTSPGALIAATLYFNPANAVDFGDLVLIGNAVPGSSQSGAAQNKKGSKGVAGLAANVTPARGGIMIGGSANSALAGDTVSATFAGTTYTSAVAGAGDSNQVVAAALKAAIDLGGGAIVTTGALVNGAGNDWYIPITQTLPSTGTTVAVAGPTGTGVIGTNPTPYKSGSFLGDYAGKDAGYVANQTNVPVLLQTPFVGANPDGNSTYLLPRELSPSSAYVTIYVSAENFTDAPLTTDASCMVLARFVNSSSVVKITA